MNIHGQVKGEKALPSDIYGVPMNRSLLHSVVKAYRANRRQGTHATKTRSLVSGSGRKPFKQKGTGRARQGSNRGPHMYHGAVAHGPQPRDYRQGINKKVKMLSTKVALSDKVRHKRLLLVDDLDVSSYSTRKVVSVLNTLVISRHNQRDDTQKSSLDPRTLIVDKRKDDYLSRSVRNIYRADTVSAALLNAENILGCEYLLLTLCAFDELNKRFADENTSAKRGA